MTINISKPKYGWTCLTIYKDKQQIINISCSGVYNPFPEITDFVNCLANHKKNHLVIDQEGRDAQIKILGYNKSNVLLEFYNPSRKIRNFYDKRLKNRKIIQVNTKQLIKEFRTKLYNWQLHNYEEVHSEDYPLYFSDKELLNSTKFVKNFNDNYIKENVTVRTAFGTIITRKGQSI